MDPAPPDRPIGQRGTGLSRLVVFASGHGSNLQVLIDACAAAQLDAQIALVVVNRPQALALQRARAAQLPVLLCPRGAQDRWQWEQGLVEALAPLAPRLLVLAGWDQLLIGPLLQRYPQAIINLHPALPGMWPGLGAIARAHEAFLRGGPAHTGVMVHRVTAEVDAGPVLAQERVALRPGEPLQALQARVHAVEHRLLLQAIAAELARDRDR